MDSKTNDRKALEAIYKEELKASVNSLRLVVTQIQKLEISATPENYAIWFAYYSKTKPDLVAALDKRIAKGLPFTPEALRQYYQQYFVEVPEQTLIQLRQAIRTLINKLTYELNEVDQGMGGYDQFLAECEVELSNEPDVQDLHRVIKDLVSHTRECRDKNQSAMLKVGELNKEVDILRQSLRLMSEEVMEDALTGIGNRRGFEDHLMQSVTTSHQKNESLMLLMLDIDYFKRVNDMHGHVVGDRVLRFVAETIKRKIKGGDYAARYGGEEFAIILPNTNAQGGVTVAKSILKEVENAKLTVSKGGKSIGSLTLSGGLAELRSDETGQQLVERADQCLYQAKNAGRNSIRSDVNGAN